MPLSRFRVVVSRVSRRRVDARARGMKKAPRSGCALIPWSRAVYRRARGIRKPAEAGLIPCWTLFRLYLFGHKPIELAYDMM